RLGDPVPGGTTRRPQMTAYRQQALGIAARMAAAPARPRDLKPLAPDAAKILQHNVYNWFERIERGLYGLTPAGHQALVTWAEHLPPQQPAPTAARAA
ncbi:MAG: DUF2161 family putative PD-(D/E)XK-type phosphodiesterase, partial [Ancalomicrobiaceae bacterium]|nr:DUF2161 family putative PD-(D/E)XK-type phosphodiesterase [Ancalomicrobiaceae bacterium]